MEAVSNLLSGFEHALTLEALIACFAGVTVGTFVGALPGVGPLAAISLCLPLTYYFEPLVALIMLAGIFYGSQYGGSISAILLNLPGDPSAAITCLDAYPITKSGRPGMALFITTTASFIGGSIGIVILLSVTEPLSDLALAFSSADYFSLILFCLLASSMLAIGSPLKGLTMVVLGLLLGMVGTDVTSGQARFTGGNSVLLDGIDLTAMMMGLFGVAEVLNTYVGGNQPTVSTRKVSLRSMIPARHEFAQAMKPALRGTAVGSVVGVLPGMGATLATIIAYAVEKRVAKDPSRFGKGAIEGIASPEAANNASVQTAFVPTLGLGIPGDAVMAVLVGALMIHGIQPGPLFIVQQPELFWGLVASMWIGNAMLLILNIPMIGIWVRMLTIPPNVLYPTILLLVCLGVYSINNSAFDVLMTIGFGIVGFCLGRYSYPMASLVLGFILSPLLEEHFRRTMLISDGDLTALFQSNISAIFLGLAFLVLISPLWRLLVRRSRTDG